MKQSRATLALIAEDFLRWRKDRRSRNQRSYASGDRLAFQMGNIDAIERQARWNTNEIHRGVRMTKSSRLI